MAKRVFCYTGESEPVGEDELRAVILAINGFDAPVSVEERGKTRLDSTLLQRI